MNRKTVVVFSGGMDSTTLLYHLLDLGHEVKAISFDYGQRHRKELDAAVKIARLGKIDHRIVDLSGLKTVFGANALTDNSVDVPHGEYSSETMQVTEVPNRNMIMLSIAAGWAISLGYDSVAFGAHSGEYTPYTDCQPEFAAAVNSAIQICHSHPVEVLAPFVHWSKRKIAERAKGIGVPIELTWSCYQGGDVECGQCSTCLDRAQALI